jgi:murein endopeptidase/LysM repeat protein
MASSSLRAARGRRAPRWVRVTTATVAVAVMLGPWARAPAEGETATSEQAASRTSVVITAEPRPEPEPSPAPEEAMAPAASGGAPESAVCSERHRVRASEGSAFIRHEAVPRESLAQIAHRYDVTPEKLREWNDLPDDVERLRKGAKLRVRPRRMSPQRERIEYVVQPGDTWWKVAVSHGVDSMDLRAYNWPYRGKMTPGETLQIWIDPLIHDWIQASPNGPLAAEERVRRGAVGVGSPNDGVLLNGVQIPEGPGYRLRFPKSAYGTTHAVEQFLEAMQIYTQGEDTLPRIAVGAMSRPRGGLLGTHQSHQTGRDLDIRLPRRPGAPAWGPLKPSRIDWEATWRLVVAFAHTDVEVIFFDYRMQRRIYRAAKEAGATSEQLAELLQYPRGSHARLGLVRHADGHEKHLHVRFRCGPCEVECT